MNIGDAAWQPHHLKEERTVAHELTVYHTVKIIRSRRKYKKQLTTL